MHSYDLSPLFRSSVGFDHLSRLIDSAFKVDERGPSYPPYNIAKLSEDDYEITMAVAGFKEDELSIITQDNTLVVRGSSAEKEEKDAKNYLHRGIATRSFERTFSLADHVRVEGASLADGLLTITLKHEIPEASKPRTIAINSSANTRTLLEGKSKKAA